MDFKSRISDELAKARNASLLRHLRPLERSGNCTLMYGRNQLIDFSSSDYLSLADDPEILAHIQDHASELGLGNVSSPLISGYTDSHSTLEQQLALIYRHETALLFPSGWQANVTLIDTLFGEGDVIFSDSMNHASLVDGCRLSKARTIVFNHCDYDNLSLKLSQLNADMHENIFGIVSDSVFSIDGDTADVAKLVELKRRHDAVLILDTAHALPRIGRDGESLLGFDEYLHEADVITTSLSKYFAAGGGMVACSNNLRDFLINRARGYIYSSSYSTLLIVALLAAIHRIESDPSLVVTLKDNIEYLRANLAGTGFLPRSGKPDGPICAIPVRADKAVDAGEMLIAMGLLVVPVRYPTVPLGTAKLRIGIMRGHTRQMIDKLLQGLVELAKGGFSPLSG